MKDAFQHGGNLEEAAIRYGCSPDSFLDFSSNLNVFFDPFPDGIPSASKSSYLVYPPASPATLETRIAELYGFDPELCLVYPGAASAFYDIARLPLPLPIHVLQPAYDDYARSLHAASVPFLPVALPPEAWHDAEAILAALAHKRGTLYLGAPNNPTGFCLPQERLRRLLEQFEAVVLDESFIEMAGRPSWLAELERVPNLLIVRSLTKSWRIPGLRIGFVATAHAPWRERLIAMRPPWPIPGPVLEWAEGLLTQENLLRLRESVRPLPAIRAEFAAGLKANGLCPLPSDSNFVLCDCARDRAMDLASVAESSDLFWRTARRRRPLGGLSHSYAQELGERGFLVRSCDSFTGMPSGRYLRFAVRKPQENEALLAAISALQVVHA